MKEKGNGCFLYWVKLVFLLVLEKFKDPADLSVLGNDGLLGKNGNLSVWGLNFDSLYKNSKDVCKIR